MIETQDRLIDLETKLAYQEYTIKQLNDVVCEQQKQIDDLTKVIDKIKSNMDVASDGGVKFNPEDEVPPHY